MKVNNIANRLTEYYKFHTDESQYDINNAFFYSKRIIIPDEVFLIPNNLYEFAKKWERDSKFKQEVEKNIKEYLYAEDINRYLLEEQLYMCYIIMSYKKVKEKGYEYFKNYSQLLKNIFEYINRQNRYSYNFHLTTDFILMEAFNNKVFDNDIKIKEIITNDIFETYFNMFSPRIIGNNYKSREVFNYIETISPEIYKFYFSNFDKKLSDALKLKQNVAVPWQLDTLFDAFLAQTNYYFIMEKESFEKFAMFFAEHNFYHKIILKKLVELNSIYIEKYKSYLLMEDLERNVYT